MRAQLDRVMSASGRKVLLICDRAAERTSLAEGLAESSSEEQIYSRLIAAVLQATDLDILLHLHRDRRGSPDPLAGLSQAHKNRVRLAARQPLGVVLSQADILVSFASSALVEGGRHGMKPVQIGLFLRGSAGFSQIFPDMAAFIDKLAAGKVEGSMSLAEHAAFETFCHDIAGQEHSPGRDPIVLACRPRHAAYRIPGKTIIDAFANPFAAMRLLLANFRTQQAALAAWRSSVAGKHSVATLVARGGNGRTS
jgi:hypothetical protein